MKKVSKRDLFIHNLNKSKFNTLEWRRSGGAFGDAVEFINTFWYRELSPINLESAGELIRLLIANPTLPVSVVYYGEYQKVRKDLLEKYKAAAPAAKAPTYIGEEAPTYIGEPAAPAISDEDYEMYKQFMAFKALHALNKRMVK